MDYQLYFPATYNIAKAVFNPEGLQPFKALRSYLTLANEERDSVFELNILLRTTYEYNSILADLLKGNKKNANLKEMSL